MSKLEHTNLEKSVIGRTHSGGGFPEARETFRRHAAIRVESVMDNFEFRMWEILARVDTSLQGVTKNMSARMPKHVDLLPVRKGRSLVWL